MYEQSKNPPVRRALLLEYWCIAVELFRCALFAALDGFVGGDRGAGWDGWNLGSNNCGADAELLA
jgi:hypothetical protein